MAQKNTQMNESYDKQDYQTSIESETLVFPLLCHRDGHRDVIPDSQIYEQSRSAQIDSEKTNKAHTEKTFCAEMDFTFHETSTIPICTKNREAIAINYKNR